MTLAMHRTGMSLDALTLRAFGALARKWCASKPGVVRQALRDLKLRADAEENKPTPQEALDRLQNGGGPGTHEAEHFRAAVTDERSARKFWWKS